MRADHGSAGQAITFDFTAIFTLCVITQSFIGLITNKALNFML
jgi:hypothetical protein